jgi:hypothetical protein
MGTARGDAEGGAAHNAFRVFRYVGDLVGSSTNMPFQASHVGYETLSLRLLEMLDNLSSFYRARSPNHRSTLGSICTDTHCDNI